MDKIKDLPLLYLARHGETAWSLAGKHTGKTDLPLSERGEQNARLLGSRLQGMEFEKVFCSPLQRARRTGQLAGFGSPEIDNDLAEWDYGDYEGKTSAEIHNVRPDWELFRDGCPHGESPAQVAARADRVLERLRSAGDRLLVFSSGHFLRMLTVRWLGVDDLTFGAHLALDTASLSLLGYEHTLSRPVIRFWNDTNHLTQVANQSSSR